MHCFVCGAAGKGSRSGIHRVCLSAAMMEIQVSTEDTLENEPSEDTGDFELKTPWDDQDNITTCIKASPLRAE